MWGSGKDPPTWPVITSRIAIDLRKSRQGILLAGLLRKFALAARKDFMFQIGYAALHRNSRALASSRLRLSSAKAGQTLTRCNRKRTTQMNARWGREAARDATQPLPRRDTASCGLDIITVIQDDAKPRPAESDGLCTSGSSGGPPIIKLPALD